MNKNITTWIFRIALAALYLMMALPKFAGQEMTVHIFTTLGVEPWGRILTGVIEVSIFLLVLLPKTTVYGAIISLGTIIGAILSHFVILGLVIKNASGTVNDGGEIFITALIILALTLINLFIHRQSIPVIGKQ
jgi:uncharacterized membrane protein YphA (DoxX/SURF4 family)